MLFGIRMSTVLIFLKSFFAYLFFEGKKSKYCDHRSVCMVIFGIVVGVVVFVWMHKI